jgi:CHAD domain-containing protein
MGTLKDRSTAAMNYKLRAGEKLPDGIRRIARKQLGRAAGLLGKKAAGARDRTLHEARQWLKKARATLRMVQPALGDGIWRREDRKLRGIARELAQRRDAEALLATVEILCGGKRAGGGENAVWEKLRRIFLKRIGEFAGETRGPRRKCRLALRAARRRAEEWPLKKLHWEDLRAGVGTVYREGRKAMREAGRTRMAEHLHEWRKRVKDLWYELRILEPVQAKGMERVADGMKKLSEYLGNDHDLAMLEGALKTCGLEAGEMKLVLGRVRARREELQRAAFKLGRRLFAEEPGKFIGRVKKSDG